MTIKAKFVKLNAFIMLLIVLEAGCGKKEELLTNTAKGKIILVTGQCYGETVLIEIENPKGIGLPGTFFFVGVPDKKISYQNGIMVPYFSKIGLPNTVSQSVGTWLYFEYREFTHIELNSELYSTNPPIACPAVYGPPSGNKIIITKIINSK